MNKELIQKVQQGTRLGFREWLAEREETILAWADQFIIGCAAVNDHTGDCTGQAISCPLCTLETLLSEYHEYRFPEKFLPSTEEAPLQEVREAKLTYDQLIELQSIAEAGIYEGHISSDLTISFEYIEKMIKKYEQFKLSTPQPASNETPVKEENP